MENVMIWTNKSQTRQSGLFTNLPSNSSIGYFVQALVSLPGILVGYLIMYVVNAVFTIDVYQYGVWTVLVSFLIVREVLAAINPRIFDLDARRKRRDTIIIVDGYLLGIVVPIVVQTQVPVKGFWNFLIALLLTLTSIYLPCILFGSSELRKAILPAKRETLNL
jgi:hypothetical protein